MEYLLDANALRYGPSIGTTLAYSLLMRHRIPAERGNGIGASCWLEPAMGTRSDVTGEGVTCNFGRLCYVIRGFTFRVYLANRRILM